MKNKDVLLVKTLLKSTSGLNVLKYSTDKKKRSLTIGNYIGMGILWICLIAYCIATTIGYGVYGLTDEIAGLCAATISIIAFFFTVLKVNGYLFNFKEYDMLMALPFETGTIASSRFLYMYVKSLPWYLCIELSMLAGYGYFVRPSFFVYVAWLVGAFFVPIIPMVIATLIGFIIAKIGSGFKNKKLIQTILTFAFIIVCFCSRFFFEAIFKDGKTEEMIQSIDSITGGISKYYPPIKWFGDSISKKSILSFILLTAVSIVLFEAFFWLISKSYRKINSLIKTDASVKKMKKEDIRKRSIVQTIAYKEFKRLVGSTLYITNAGVGELMALILGVVALFVDAEVIIAKITDGAPLTKEMLLPAIPFIIYFLIGMVPTTTCSPSLEGKNYWIVQSMPIDSRDLYKGKMLFNMYLTVPFAVFSTICLCISADAGIVNTVMYTITGIVLCALSTTWGCVCGIRHIRLEWENEVEVIKQGAAVATYLLPNMIITMGLLVGVVALGMKLNQMLVNGLITAVAAVLAILCYKWVMLLSNKR